MTQPKRTLSQYISDTKPSPRHQKAGEKVATRQNPMSAGWAWNPDEETQKAIARGNRRYRKAKARQQEDAKMATKKAKGRKSSKKVSKKTGAKKVAAKKTASNLIPLKKVCQAAKLDPKMARRTLRASTKWMKVHTSRGRWEFTKAQATAVQKFLAA